MFRRFFLVASFIVLLADSEYVPVRDDELQHEFGDSINADHKEYVIDPSQITNVTFLVVRDKPLIFRPSKSNGIDKEVSDDVSPSTSVKILSQTARDYCGIEVEYAPRVRPNSEWTVNLYDNGALNLLASSDSKFELSLSKDGKVAMSGDGYATKATRLSCPVGPVDEKDKDLWTFKLDVTNPIPGVKLLLAVDRARAQIVRVEAADDVHPTSSRDPASSMSTVRMDAMLLGAIVLGMLR